MKILQHGACYFSLFIGNMIDWNASTLFVENTELSKDSYLKALNNMCNRLPVNPVVLWKPDNNKEDYFVVDGYDTFETLKQCFHKDYLNTDICFNIQSKSFVFDDYTKNINLIPASWLYITKYIRKHIDLLKTQMSEEEWEIYVDDLDIVISNLKDYVVTYVKLIGHDLETIKQYLTNNYK